MNRRLFILVAVALVCIGCATPSPPPETENSEADQQTTMHNRNLELLRRLTTQVVFGSEEMLLNVLHEINTSTLTEVRAGNELYYISYQYLSLLYPKTSLPEPQPSLSPSSMYPDIFSAVREGELYPDPGESFHAVLPDLSRSLVLLTAEGTEVKQQAAAIASQMIDRDIRSIIPYYLLGMYARERGENQEAIECFREVTSMTSSCYPAQRELALLYFEGQQYNKALEEIEELLTRFSQDLQLLRMAARSYYQLGEYEKALSYTGEFLRYEEDPAIMKLRIRIFLQMGNYEPAKKLLKVVERIQEVTVDLLLLKAELYAASDNYFTARSAMEEALEREPGNVEILESYGQLLMETGDVERGVELLNKVLEKEPDRRATQMLLLNNAMENRDWRRAKTIITDMQPIEDNPELLQKSITVFTRLGEKEAAYAAAEKLYQLDPSNPDYFLPFIEVLISNDKVERARELIEKGLSLVENRSRRSQLYYLKGLTMDDNEKRISLFQDALFEDLENVDALVAISDGYRKKGDYLKALRYINQAVRLRPQNQKILEKKALLEGLVE
jgi:tetratricopeptide (TPR) repeat protein